MICHGDYDPEVKEYFLEFENSKAELLKIHSSKLRTILKNEDLSSIKLVFVNACHSEEVAKIFLEFGVRCVIVIQGKHKINDAYARAFSNFLYEGIIEGESIKEAFNSAIFQLEAFYMNEDDSCCCGHSHKEDCQWVAHRRLKGGENAHFAHESYC